MPSIWFVDSPDAEAFHFFADCAALKNAVQPVVAEHVSGFARTVETRSYGELHPCARCRGRVDAEHGPDVWQERLQADSAAGTEAMDLLLRGEEASPAMLRGDEPLRVFKQNFLQLRIFVDRVEIKRPVLLGGGEPAVIPFADIRGLRPVSWIPLLRSPAIEIDSDIEGEALTERFELDIRDSPELLVETIRGLMSGPAQRPSGQHELRRPRRPGQSRRRSATAMSSKGAEAAEADGGWWDEVESWSGPYQGRFWGRYPDGDWNCEVEHSFEGSLFLQRVEGTEAIWRGRLTGQMEAKFAAVAPSDVQRLVGSGSADVEVELKVSWGKQDWSGMDPDITIRSTGTWIDKDGTDTWQEDSGYRLPGSFAFVWEWTEMPATAQSLGGSAEVQHDDGTASSVSCTLKPSGGGGGDFSPSGGDRVRGPYDPTWDLANPIYQILKGGERPDSGKWQRYAENWIAGSIKQTHKAALRETLAWVRKDVDLKSEYPDEMGWFEQSLFHAVGLVNDKPDPPRPRR